MNIIGYLKRFGSQSLSETPFNEVDALVFAELSYVNFQLACPEEGFASFHDLKIEDEKAFYYGSVDKKGNKILVDLLRKSRRFEGCKVGLCKQETKDGIQFFALTFILPNGNIYVSYRGTDITINGWKEDFEIVFSDTLPSQLLALEYLKKVLKITKGKIYLGGHSKGGNLAIYSALNMGKENEDRLLKAFSFDGPGFSTPIEKSEAFKRLDNKLSKFITNGDIIGIIFNKSVHPTIVFSTGLLLGGHDPFYWKVQAKKPKFVCALKRKKNSYRFEEAFLGWMDCLEEKDKRFFIENLFKIFEETTTIYDFIKCLNHELKTMNDLSKEDKEKMLSILSRFIRLYLSTYRLPSRFAISRKKR